MLGVYPDEKCFDPNRPSWLPYWLDTWNESVCEFDNNWLGIDSKMNFRSPAAGYSPGVPESALQAPYYVSQEDIERAQREKAEVWRKSAIPDPPSDEFKLPVLWVAVGVAVLVVFLRRR